MICKSTQSKASNDAFALYSKSADVYKMHV